MVLLPDADLSKAEMALSYCKRLFAVSKNYTLEETEIESLDPSLLLKNVNYYVTKRNGPWWKGCCFRPVEQMHVLKKVNVKFESGQLTAILGSSGSGKTSLLDVIACRAEGRARGKITYKHRPINIDVMKENAAYVLQADRLLANLTVRETLVYAAYLRLPGETTASEINEKVDSVIKEIGLTDVADCRIGGTIVRGISGGEKRRVTIAIHLLQNPDILLLDEPTTGLDSCNARSLVSRLKEITRKGTTIILSIHQPGSQLFRIFDKIVLLSEGRLAFFGSPSSMLDFFQSLGYKCPNFANPMDHFIDVVSIDRRNEASQKECEARLKYIAETFTSWLKKDEVTNGLSTSYSNNSFIDVSSAVVRKKRYLPGIRRQTATLLRRMMTNSFRDRSVYISRLFLMVLYVPFIVAFLGRMGTDQNSVQDRVGLMYQTLIVPPYTSSLNVAAIFPAMRELFFRETRDGLYSTSVFVIVYVLHVIPFQLFSGAIFCSVVYWVTGLVVGADRFFIYFAVVIILQFIGEVMAVGAMAVFWNGQIATNVVTLTLTASLLFASGLLRSIESILDIFKWIRWVTIHKYATEILVANEFHNLNLTCQNTNVSICQFNVGDDYLDVFFPGAIDNIGINFAVLSGQIVSFILCTIIVLKIRTILNK